MSVMNVFSLLGGLSLFLFGMKIMGEGLERTAGNRLKNILNIVTHNRVLAVLAGNDMLVTGDYAAQIPQVLAAVEEGRIGMEQLDSAVLRVLRWKARLGLLDGAA